MRKTYRFNPLHEKIISLLSASASEPVIVLGGGVTGRGVVEALSKAGYHTLVIDESELKLDAKESYLTMGAKVEDRFIANSENCERLSSSPLALASPGINPEGALIKGLKAAGITVLSELDFATAFVGMPDVAVTGTNGKTTTVNIIQQMLINDGRKSALVGNVGRPLVGQVTPWMMRGQKPSEGSHYIAELSSFQLAGVEHFFPRVAVWLNIEDDHLEWHGNFEAYYQAKLRITLGQRRDDFFIVNINDPRGERVLSDSPARKIPVGIVDSLPVGDGCFVIRGGKHAHCRINGTETKFRISSFKPRGDHNKINLCAAIAAAKALDVSNEAIRWTIDQFKLPPHRIELVPSSDGRIYINDSKGTNVSAVVVAVRTVSQDYAKAGITLLLGGKSKEGGWESVKALLGEPVSQVICFGADAAKIADQLQWANLAITETLEDAVRYAKEYTKSGDVILLSPGCASFDAYSGYAERGEHFRRLVSEV